MSTDLEDRLRAMYAAVAEQTIVDDPPPAPLLEPTVQHGRHPSRAKVLAVVAVAALVIGGLAYVVGRERSTTPVKPPVTIGPATGPRTFALPMFLGLPDGFGYDGAYVAPLGDLDWLDGFPGAPALGADVEVAAVRYLGPNGGVFTMVSTAAPGVEPAAGTGTMALPDGATAQLNAATDASGITTAAWREPGGPLVAVSTPAIDLDTLKFIISNVWLVDRTLWDQATAHAGFLDAYSNSTPGFDAWTPPGPRIGATIALTGSLQTRLSIFTGLSGTMSYGPEVSCWSQQTVESTDGRQLLLIANGPIDSFTVQPRGGDAITVPAGAPPGLLRWRFATVELDRPADSIFVSSTVQCEGATP